MVDWPSTLPAPQRGDYSYTVDMGLRRTKFDSGVSRLRRRHNAQPVEFTLSFDMTTAQTKTFVQFLNTDGLDWFNMDLPTYANETGELKSPVSIRFISDPNFSALTHDRYMVTIAAEAASILV